MKQPDQPDEDVQETRDIRSPRSRSPHAHYRMRSSRSPSESSHRSASPTTGKRSANRTPSAESEEARPRRFSKSSGPKLNTWDVPEFLPGALPRANPVQRAFFEERSKKVFQNNRILDSIEAEESRDRLEAESALQIESDLQSLKELFPLLDYDLIQETYLLMDGNLDQTINQLLLISQGIIDSDIPRTDSKGPPSSDDEREFPSLKEGYNKESDGSNYEITMVEMEELNYKDRLLGKSEPNS